MKQLDTAGGQFTPDEAIPDKALSKDTVKIYYNIRTFNMIMKQQAQSV